MCFDFDFVTVLVVFSSSEEEELSSEVLTKTFVTLFLVERSLGESRFAEVASCEPLFVFSLLSLPDELRLLLCRDFVFCTVSTILVFCLSLSSESSVDVVKISTRFSLVFVPLRFLREDECRVKLAFAFFLFFSVLRDPLVAVVDQSFFEQLGVSRVSSLVDLAV